MKLKRIIVEGCDNCGKTTLIEKLSKEFGMEVVNSCRSIPLDDQFRWIQSQIMSKPVIHDRFTLISENVYGPILRSNSKFEPMVGPGYMGYCSAVVAALDAIVIWCNPKVTTIEETFHERKQIAGAEHNITKICLAYKHQMRLWEGWGSIVLQYDWKQDKDANKLIKKLKRWEQIS